MQFSALRTKIWISWCFPTSLTCYFNTNVFPIPESGLSALPVNKAFDNGRRSKHLRMLAAFCSQYWEVGGITDVFAKSIDLSIYVRKVSGGISCIIVNNKIDFYQAD